MNTLHFLRTSWVHGLQSFRALALLALATTAINSVAQIQTAAPTVFNLAVASGGAFASTATPLITNGTGDRQAIATICSSLNVGATPGVSVANPCSPGTTFSSVNVGAATSSLTPQNFGASFSAAQLAGFIPTLAAAGQAQGSRRFFVVIQYTASPIFLPNAPRVVTLQINLIEPVAGLTQATASLQDVALNAPSTVNVRYTLAGSDTPLAGQFCSALNAASPPNGVSLANPCAPASALGNAGSAIGFTNAAQTNETLVVPGSIASQAAARAQISGNSIFYFVRQFSSGKFAVIQLRLNNNAANAPLAFSEIRLGFKDGGSLQNLGFFKRGQVMPPVSAALRYRGAGVLRARWEIVMPSDTPPTALDLQAEAAFSPLERAQQRRYRVLDRVNIYLPAAGQAVLSGPPPRLLPNEQYGQYLLMLRIESSDSISGQSAGHAPFALPVLRYYIGESSGPSGQATAIRSEPQAINLLAPADAAALSADAPTVFQWQDSKNASLYRLEIEANGKTAFAARVKPSAQDGILRYTAPPFIVSTLVNKAARWRVVALASDGQLVGVSDWREIANAPMPRSPN